MPVVEQDFATVGARDQAAKPDVMQRQRALLAERYDLSNRPELGDVSQGKVLTIKNYYALMDGILTPVHMEGLRVLLTPFPQQQFNQTDDRKTDAQSLGVTCFDCHVNGHT
jgi:hypothetical protein